jgi:hypothetical protein
MAIDEFPAKKENLGLENEQKKLILLLDSICNNPQKR